MKYGDTIYAGNEDNVTLTLGHDTPTGYTTAYTASAGELSGNTLTMPDDDVVISVSDTINKYTVTLPENMEFVPVSETSEFDYDSTVSFKVKDGYTASDVQANGTPLTPDANGIYTITVEDAVTITATVTRSPYVAVSVTGGGTVTVGEQTASDGGSFEVIGEKGDTITLTLTPDSGKAVRSIEYGYTDSSGSTGNGIKLPVSGSTATLTIPDDLKDGTGVTMKVTFAPALVGGADEASAVALTDNTVTDLVGGWYKVESDITFDHMLYLLSDTHLVIANGATMTVNTDRNNGIDSEYTLNVSGEGSLDVITSESYNIAVRVGNYVQTGATVTVSGYHGIRCKNSFSDTDNDFIFIGGQLTATGNGGDGILANGNITLGYTNATDYIHSSSYPIGGGRTIAVASGQVLTDGTNFYSGTLTRTEIKSLADKTLVRAYAVNLPENTTGGTITADKDYVAANADDKTVSLTVTPDEGYAVKSVSVNGTAIEPVEGVYSFTMPNEDVTVSAEFTFSDGTGARLEGSSLSIQDDGDIGVNFYMLLDDSIVNNANAKMRFVIPINSKNNETKTLDMDIPTPTTLGGKNYYIFKCPVAAKEMTAAITAQVYVGDEAKGDPYTYTVRDYAEYLINHTEGNEAYTKALPLVKAMLHYGASAQTLFNNIPGDLANKNIAPSAYGDPTQTIKDLIDASRLTNLNTASVGDNLTFDGASLNLGSKTAYTLYYKKEAGYSGTAPTITCEGHEVKVVETASEIRYVIQNISAGELLNNIKVTIGTTELTVNPATYFYAALTAQNTNEYDYGNLKTAVTALYYFNEAAKSYKGVQ